jgi:hypothetical protein
MVPVRRITDGMTVQVTYDIDATQAQPDGGDRADSPMDAGAGNQTDAMESVTIQVDDDTTEDGYIALAPESVGADGTGPPEGFRRCAQLISEDAMKKSGGTSSQVASGTRSRDGTLWVNGKRYSCKEAYELYIMASVRGETCAQAFALHVADKTRADAWKQKLKPCPAELADTERRSLDSFERWWVTQDDGDSPLPMELTGLDGMLTDNTGEARTVQRVERVNSVTAAREKDPNILEVSTSDTHTVLVTLGSINNRPVRILNDSGADASVMSEQCARRLQLNVKREGNLPTLRNPNGDGLHCVGVVETTVFMAEQHLQLRAYVVTDLTIELLVGGDFLQKHRAVLSYADLSVSYHGIDARVYMEPYKEQKAYAKTDHAAVVTTEDINLQGDKIITIQALAQLDTAGIRSAKSWEFIPLEALTLECGILIPHTMVTVDKDGMVPVTLRTAFGQDMILAKGTVLGTLRTIQHIVSVRSIAKNDVDPQPKDDTVTRVPREADEAKFALFLEKTLKELPLTVDDTMKADLIKVLTKHKATICAKTLGETSVTTFDMVLNPGGPVRHRDRRWSNEELSIMKEQIDMLQKMGMIEESDSDWASRLVLVTKKDGSTRVCVDYREVN